MAYYVAVYVNDPTIPGPLGLFFNQQSNTNLAVGKAAARAAVAASIGYSVGQRDAAYAAGKIISDLAKPTDVKNPQIV